MNSRQITRLANKLQGLKLIIYTKEGYELIHNHNNETDNINHMLKIIQIKNYHKKEEEIEDFVICYVDGKIKSKDFNNNCLYTLNESFKINIPTIGVK